jgi:hypothetical protein
MNMKTRKLMDNELRGGKCKALGVDTKRAVTEVLNACLLLDKPQPKEGSPPEEVVQ